MVKGLDIPDSVIEIHDPEIDPTQIMAQIRERIRQRREAVGEPQRHFPSFEAAAYPGEPEGEHYDADLYYHLRRANERYAQMEVEPLLAPSSISQLPILGPLWQRLRREAHNLVLFYLNRLARQQVAVNRHLVSTLNRMTVQLEEQRRQIRALQEEVRRLRGED
jgi:hypothetical protein